MCGSAFVFSVSTMSCPLHNLSTSFNTTLLVIVITTKFCISAVLAFVENTVVLLTMRKIHLLRTTTRYFMTSLAAAELFSGVTANAFFSSWLILNHLRQGTSDVLWKTFSLREVVALYLDLWNCFRCTNPLLYNSSLLF